MADTAFGASTPVGPQFLPQPDNGPQSETAPMAPPVEANNPTTAATDALGAPAQPAPPHQNYAQKFAGHFENAVKKFAPPTTDYVPDGKGGVTAQTRPGGLANLGKAISVAAISALGGSQESSPEAAADFARKQMLNAGIGPQANAAKRQQAQAQVKADQEGQEAADRHTMAMGTIKYNELQGAKLQFDLSKEQTEADEKLAGGYEQTVSSARNNGQDVVELPTVKDVHQLADPAWQAAHPQYASLVKEYMNHEWQLVPRVSTDANGKPIHEGVTLIKAPPREWMQSRIAPDDSIATSSPYYNKDKKGIDVYGLDPANPKGPLKVAYTAPLGALKGSDLEVIRSKNDNIMLQHDKDVADVKASQLNLKTAIANLKEATDEDSKLSKAIGDLTTPFKTTDEEGKPQEGMMLRPDASARIQVLNRMIDQENKGKKPEDQMHRLAVSKDGNTLVDATTGLPFGQKPEEEAPAAASAPEEEQLPAPSNPIGNAVGSAATGLSHGFHSLLTNEVFDSDIPALAQNLGKSVADVKKQLQASGKKIVHDPDENPLKPPTPGAKLTDAAIVQKYLQAANGNKQAAKTAAQKDGWSF